jgi:hypothetical protein
MQDFVGVRVADARDGPLIFQNALELRPPGLGQQAGQ